MSKPSSAIALMVGLLFTCAAATALGIVGYESEDVHRPLPHVLVRDHAGQSVIGVYTLLALAFLTAAQLFHSRELRRSY